MKKTAKCEGGRAEKPGACGATECEAAESSRHRKLYEGRIEELGLARAPVVAEVSPVRQFQLAQLAATLARKKDFSASELAGKAIQIWNASGRAMFVEQQAALIVRGLFIFDRRDWETHARALVGLLDDVEGAVPGSPSDQVRKSYEQGQGKAGAAVAQLWKYGPRNPEVLKVLFPAKSETEETRGEKLVELLAFAKTKVDGCDELTWMAKDGDRLKGCILHAWGPLGIWKDGAEVLKSALRQVGELIAKPAEAAGAQLGFYPMVARWLAVMRQHYLAAAKNRS